MTDIWELANFVERYPDDYEQRWRLAKKMYLAWEYRLALEHLQVLRNEWEPRPNVRRYLGATLFRLNRLDEAAKELEEAAEDWPTDIEIHQQLARVLDAAGRTKDAIKAWEKILELEPGHEFGPSILKKLRKKDRIESGEELPDSAPQPPQRKPDTSDVQRRSQFEPGATVVCQNCGANNGPEFQTCWQCRGSLEYALPARVSEEPVGPPPVPIERLDGPWIALGLAVILILSIGMYFTFLELFPEEPVQDSLRIPVSMSEYFAYDMQMTRLTIGIILLIVWPLAFRMADVLLALERVDVRRLTGAGLFMCAYAYLALWLPSPLPLYAVAAIPAITLAICFVAFPANIFQRGMIWIVQGAAVLLVLGTVLAAFHGFGMVRDLPRILAHGFERSPEDVFEWTGTIPESVHFEIEQQDATWLNETASRIAVYAEPGPFTRRVFLELAQDGTTLEFVEIEPGGIWFVYSKAIVGEGYTLSTSGQAGTDVSLRIRSLAPVNVLPAQNEQEAMPTVDDNSGEPPVE